jgi:hypothetical protein
MTLDIYFQSGIYLVTEIWLVIDSKKGAFL